MKPQAACVLTSWPPLRLPPLLPLAELLAVAGSTCLCPGWPFSCLQRQQPHKLKCKGCCRRYNSLPQEPCHWQLLALFCCSHACCHLPVIPFLAFDTYAVPAALAACLLSHLLAAPCPPLWLACRPSLHIPTLPIGVPRHSHECPQHKLICVGRLQLNRGAVRRFHFWVSWLYC
jgi:hypothetical protein